MKDINNKELQNGDIIDITQTVNGENIFIVLNTKDLDIRYGRDISLEYGYDKKELISPDPLTGESEFKIIGNINKLIESIRQLNELGMII